MAQITIGQNRKVGDFLKPYFVAELNSSHFGELSNAKAMIDAAKDSGCDCVKFQSWSADTLYCDGYYATNPIAKRMVNKFALNYEEQKNLAAYCRSIDIDFASTPYSIDEAKFLASECDVPFLKIASMELNNLSYLRALGEMKIPIVLSTGMGSMDEIVAAVDTILCTGNTELIILHCTAVYPSPAKIIRLNNILGLRSEFPDIPIGFSDHSLGIEISTAAVALGACLIEKHFTLDNKKIGLDNQMATEPDQMKLMVDACSSVNEAMGGTQRMLTIDELDQIPKMRRSLVAKVELVDGQPICEDNIEFKRPGDGITPSELGDVMGRTVNKNIKQGHQIFYSDLY